MKKETQKTSEALLAEFEKIVDQATINLGNGQSSGSRANIRAIGFKDKYEIAWKSNGFFKGKQAVITGLKAKK